MAAMRGARGILNIGVSSLRIARVSNRNLTSLGVTALSQTVGNKIRFSAVSALPVNKFDLKGLGVTATTSPALFSTESFEALADEAVSDDLTDDGETGMERKWPSPITHVTKQDNTTVFVGGYGLNWKKISDELKQFGKVRSVNIPLKRLYQDEPDKPDRYRYGFVEFESQVSFNKAIQTSSVTTEEGKTLEIKLRNHKSNVQLENERSIVVENLPENITVDAIVEHFNSLAIVEMVNLIIQPRRTDKTDFAIVVFDSNSSIDNVMQKNHEINGQTLNIKKVEENARKQRRNRARKILLQGVEDLNADTLKNFFDSISLNAKVFSLKDNTTDQPNGLALVEFNTLDAAASAIDKNPFNIDGHSVEARRLGYSKE